MTPQDAGKSKHVIMEEKHAEIGKVPPLHQPQRNRHEGNNQWPSWECRCDVNHVPARCPAGQRSCNILPPPPHASHAPKKDEKDCGKEEQKSPPIRTISCAADQLAYDHDLMTGSRVTESCQCECKLIPANILVAINRASEEQQDSEIESAKFNIIISEQRVGVKHDTSFRPAQFGSAKHSTTWLAIQSIPAAVSVPWQCVSECNSGPSHTTIHDFTTECRMSAQTACPPHPCRYCFTTRCIEAAICELSVPLFTCEQCKCSIVRQQCKYPRVKFKHTRHSVMWQDAGGESHLPLLSWLHVNSSIITVCRVGKRNPLSTPIHDQLRVRAPLLSSCRKQQYCARDCYAPLDSITRVNTYSTASLKISYRGGSSTCRVNSLHDNKSAQTHQRAEQTEGDAGKLSSRKHTKPKSGTSCNWSLQRPEYHADASSHQGTTNPCFSCDGKETRIHAMHYVSSFTAGSKLKEAVNISENNTWSMRLSECIDPADAHAVDVLHHRVCWSRNVENVLLSKIENNKDHHSTALIASDIELINLLEEFLLEGNIACTADLRNTYKNVCISNGFDDTIKPDYEGSSNSTLWTNYLVLNIHQQSGKTNPNDEQVPQEISLFLKWCFIGKGSIASEPKHIKQVDERANRLTQSLMYECLSNNQKHLADNPIRHIRELPLQVCAGLSVHHLTRSTKLVNFLHNTGMSVHYSRVWEIEQQVAKTVLEKVSDSGGLYIPPDLVPGRFVHFAVDNIDLIEDTPDGRNTLHGTVIVAYQLIEEGDVSENRSISTSNDMLDISETIYPITFCSISKSCKRKNPKINIGESGRTLTVTMSAATQDIVWMMTGSLKLKNHEQGQHEELFTWSAHNSVINKAKHKSRVCIMPILPLPATDSSTQYTTMKTSENINNKIRGPDQKVVVTADLGFSDTFWKLVECWQDSCREVHIWMGHKSTVPNVKVLKDHKKCYTSQVYDQEKEPPKWSAAKKKQKGKALNLQSLAGSLLKFATSSNSESTSNVPDESNFRGDVRENTKTVYQSKCQDELDLEENRERQDNEVLTNGRRASVEDKLEEVTLEEDKLEGDNRSKWEQIRSNILYDDISGWSFPVPDNQRVNLIKRGSEVYQNKDGPLGTVTRSVSQTVAETEKMKWREISERPLHVTLFLVQQSLPFRGHREHMLSDNRENYLQLVELVSKYDPVLREHLIKLEQAGKSQAGYFQLTGKKALDITEDTIKAIAQNGLDITFCRGQGYDNASTMAGVHSGVQARIQEPPERRTMMPGENAQDEPLLLNEESKRSMLECIDRFYQEIDTRSKYMESILARFTVLDPKNMITTSEDELPQLLQNLVVNYDELSEDGILREIPRLRRHLQAARKLHLQTERRGNKEWTQAWKKKWVTKSMRGNRLCRSHCSNTKSIEASIASTSSVCLQLSTCQYLCCLCCCCFFSQHPPPSPHPTSHISLPPDSGQTPPLLLPTPSPPLSHYPPLIKINFPYTSRPVNTFAPPNLLRPHLPPAPELSASLSPRKRRIADVIDRRRQGSDQPRLPGAGETREENSLRPHNQKQAESGGDRRAVPRAARMLTSEGFLIPSLARNPASPNVTPSSTPVVDDVQTKTATEPSEPSDRNVGVRTKWMRRHGQCRPAYVKWCRLYAQTKLARSGSVVIVELLDFEYCPAKSNACVCRGFECIRFIHFETQQSEQTVLAVSREEVCGQEQGSSDAVFCNDVLLSGRAKAATDQLFWSAQLSLTSELGFHLRPGHRIFASGSHAGRCRWSAGFTRGPPVYPAPSFQRRPILTSITLIGSQELAVKEPPKSLHSLRLL
ncbi:hypothetical protein PR048_029060 [Dryococelus australis]|uniref:Uncharacterized protein n=1 Tax=Dryococelus australis TaxID=614101 RepID=A0ABQ9GCA5_9NEOP|nr:hypothetical protein PR048_029060 [Dryococelus australis]